jgi:hypothetical protein
VNTKEVCIGTLVAAMGPHAAHLHDRVPHLFEFLEDNYMVEWWDCDFRSWYYQPYRDRISRAFEAAKVLGGDCPALASCSTVNVVINAHGASGD